MGASRVVRFRSAPRMKLIAVKHISRTLPKGAIFDIDDKKARVLLALKLAKRHVDLPAPAGPPVDESDPDSASDPHSSAPRRGRASQGRRPA
jgi:hypothetical protein